MSIKYSIMTLIASVLFAVGCGDNKQEVAKHGYLRIKNETEKGTKAVSTVNFVVSVHSNNGDTRVFSSIYSQCPDLIELEQGDYNIKVRYPSEKDYKNAEFEQPLFMGKLDRVDIYEDKITEVREISADIKNMLVSVEFSDDLRNWFSEYSVEVSINNGADKLSYNALTTTIGYFSVAPLTIKFSGTRKENSEDVYTHTFPVIDDTNVIVEKYHHKIKISGSYVYPTTNSTKAVDSNVLNLSLGLCD